MLMGDFNVVRKASERLVGYDCRAALSFNQRLRDIEMEELASKGPWFTWSNKRGGLGDNKSRLDRVLVNEEWLNTFKDAETVIFSPGISDHCSLVVTMLPGVTRHRPFKFYNFWMGHNLFKSTVSDSWNEPVFATPSNA